MARDLRLDSVRGLLLAQIAFVHASSPLTPMVSEVFGRVSSAFGFIFISGVVGGAVYSRVAARGAREIFRRSVWRAGQIHTHHIACYLLLLGVVAILPAINDYFQFAFADPSVEVWQTVVHLSWLDYQPRFFDILPIYTLFVLFMPAALLAFRAGRARIVLAISISLWILAQYPAGDPSTWISVGVFRPFDGAFNPLAWQFVFFTGLYLGYMHMYRRVPVVRYHPVLLGVAVLVLALGLSLRWNWVDWPATFQPGAPLSSKRDFGPAYLIDCAAFTYLVHLLARRHPRGFVWPPLAFLGQHSLQVFSFHVLVVYLLMPMYWRAERLMAGGHDLLGLLVVLSLYLPAALHARLRARTERSPASAVPAAALRDA